MEIKLGVVNKFKKFPAFFYPHNLDFRGRAYPVHAHLQHLGSDHCRGLLEFAEGKPLGERGLFWLKVHVANVYAAGGVDKLPFSGRVEFIDSTMDEILDSAENPIKGKRWWMGAEDPFQCLAACFELHKAMKLNDPREHVCFLPVHQDGSCNGLQHYAALGLDKHGAREVNLMPREKPGDVYTGIAKIVARKIDELQELIEMKDEQWPEDKAVKLTRKQSLMQATVQVLKGKVDRKLVKQTVMTSVYGVTPMGAKDQIRSRIREKGLLGGSEEEEKLLEDAAKYSAQITLEALEEMFVSARQIMAWLGVCADHISQQGELVHWTTPLGLPVVQPYKKGLKTKILRTPLTAMRLSDYSAKAQVDTAKQKKAFPPNFVHSLDSTHMMQTALACKHAGITFAGVHDSYWTHAGTVDTMNRLLREEFVSLYKKPILEELKREFEARYPAADIPPLPKRGDFDLEEVLESTYFFN